MNHFNGYIMVFLIFLSISFQTEAKEPVTGGESPACKLNALQRSQKMIRTILDDLTVTYTHTGGGGITHMGQSATNTFIVRISQEERIDQFEYRLRVGADCAILIESKTESTINPR